jgi:hypothetical protein
MVKNSRRALPKPADSRLKRLLRSRAITVFQVISVIVFVPLMFVVWHPISGTISYRTEWETGKTTLANGAWDVVNNRGYHIHVTKGYIVSYSTTLNECDHLTGIVDWLSSLVAPKVAQAGHTSGGPDPAAIKVAHVDSLTALQSIDLGTVTVNEYSYCKGHYLIARADDKTIGLPQDVDLIGSSVYIEGTYRAEDHSDSTAFVIKTGVANGALYDITPQDSTQKVNPVVGSTPIQIVIKRQLDSLFKDVDFATMDDAARAQAVLDALIGSTQMQVSGGKVH